MLIPRLSFLLLVVLYSLTQVFSVTPAWAAEDPPPRLVLNTFGPNGQTRSIAFSRDSRRLYTGGRDKVVHVWEVGWNDRVRGPGADRLTYVRPLRWEITRGTRGQIHAIASNPVRDEIAIGGLSVRQQSGDISIVDAGASQITGSLPTPGSRTQDNAGAGHIQTVQHLDYSPDGVHLLSTDVSERTFLWKRSALGNWSGRELMQGGGSRFNPSALLFTSRDRFVAGSRQDDGSVLLREYDLEGNVVTRFPEAYPDRVAALARADNGDWASASITGQVYLNRMNNPQGRVLKRTAYPVVTAMAFGVGNMLAVASNERESGGVGRAAIELFDTASGQRIDLIEFNLVEKLVAVAISPDGQFLATHFDDAGQIRVFRLRIPAGDLIANPLSQGRITIGQGLGRPVRSVAVSTNGKSLGFGFAEGRYDYQLELLEGRVETTAIGNFAPLRPSFPTWTATPDPRDITRIQIRNQNDIVEEISLSPRVQGLLTVACFIGRNGQSRPDAVAIGTEVNNGVFVYSLREQAGPPRLLRWFYDHSHIVSSLAVLPDGKMLASGSHDGTVKLWSLEGLFARDPIFPSASIWGAKFVVRNGQLVVIDVDSQGVAHAKGLRDGDVLDLVRGQLDDDARTVVGAAAPPATAAQMLDALNRGSVFLEFVLRTRAAEPKFFVIRPGWEPIVTIYADRRGEWAVWHPQGFFNASPAEGGGLFGWQFNQGQDTPPRILVGDQLQKEFERPDVIQSLLLGNSLQRALAASNQPQATVQQIASQVPEVKILAPLPTDQIANQGKTTLLASVRFPANDREAYTMRAAVDGFRLGPPDSQRQVGDSWQFSWQCELSSKLNQIEVMASQRGGALNALYDSDIVYVRGRSPGSNKYRLHLLMLASEDYPGNVLSGSEGRSGLGKLEFPIDDVTEVQNSLALALKNQKAEFLQGEWLSLQNRQINPQTVKSSIASLERAIQDRYAGEKNVLMLYLSGHGLTVNGEYHYVTVSTPSTADQDVAKHGIPWSLLESAGQRDCQVIYMLDTCHSGVAADLKSSIRDPLRSQGIVFAAATGKSVALERSEYGHGVFTLAVLRGIDGDADGVIENQAGEVEMSEGDNLVDLTELINFVKKETFSLSGGAQKPSLAPSRLTDTLDLPIVKL